MKMEPPNQVALHMHEPSIKDIKVTIQDSTLIHPPQRTDEEQPFFLSEIDQLLGFHVDTVHFFRANPDFPTEMVVACLNNAIQKVMVHYDFLAGRLQLNHHTGRLEIGSKGSGVGFVVAASEVSLDELGDLTDANPAFRQFIVPGLGKFDDKPLMVFQVTSLTCGGFVMGFSFSHVLFDGLSVKRFLENLASQSFDGKPLATTQCMDRRLLAARSPPQVTFRHPELLNLSMFGEEDFSIYKPTPKELECKIFRLSCNDINYLKEKAKPSGKSHATTKATSFNTVTAYIWRCRALTHNAEINDKDNVSTLLYAVDIRSMLNQSVPHTYCGNAVLNAYASAKISELELESNFPKIVELVKQGTTRITEEYARSTIDWLKTYKYKVLANGDFLITSWWKSGFGKMVYPWGKPEYYCPVAYHNDSIITLLPQTSEDTNNDGVNVLVILPPHEMEKFQSLFYDWINDHNQVLSKL